MTVCGIMTFSIEKRGSPVTVRVRVRVRVRIRVRVRVRVGLRF